MRTARAMPASRVVAQTRHAPTEQRTVRKPILTAVEAVVRPVNPVSLARKRKTVVPATVRTMEPVQLRAVMTAKRMVLRRD